MAGVLVIFIYNIYIIYKYVVIFDVLQNSPLGIWHCHLSRLSCFRGRFCYHRRKKFFLSIVAIATINTPFSAWQLTLPSAPFLSIPTALFRHPSPHFRHPPPKIRTALPLATEGTQEMTASFFALILENHAWPLLFPYPRWKFSIGGNVQFFIIHWFAAVSVFLLAENFP